MCTSLEFNEFFGSSFDVPCFVFSSFVVQFSRYRFATALCDSLYSISYSVPFVKGLSKLFSSFFSTFSFAPSRNFLLLFAFSLSSLSLGHRLPCGALLYYHFLPLLSTPFCTFSPFFRFFYPFFSTFRGFWRFLTDFWVFGWRVEGVLEVYSDLCLLMRGLINLGTFKRF